MTTDQCPFCGKHETAIGYEYQSRVYVFCERCGARGPWTMGDDAGARLSWRTRDPDLLAALKELVASQLAPYPPFEAGADAQNAWSERRAKACTDAEVVIAKAEGRGNV